MPYASPTLAFTTKTNKVDLVDAAHINLAQTELVNINTRLANAMQKDGTLLQGASYVSPALTGQLFYRTDLGQVFIYNSSSGWGTVAALSNIQKFTSSGTFTAPSGITTVYLSIIGGGGGGGGASAGANGGGGAAGVCYINKPYTVVPGVSYTVTIGAGGAGNTGTGDGTQGGTTSFDALSCAGGNGGIGQASGGAGGSSASKTTGTGTGKGLYTTDGGASGGYGAGSPFGDGTAGGNPASNASANTGAGGGGGVANGGDGGTGGSGLCIVMY